MNESWAIWMSHGQYEWVMGNMNESWYEYKIGMRYINIQPIAERVAQNLEIVSKTFSTNQNSAHGIYDEYQVIHDQSHENPGTPGTKSKFLRNNLKMLCRPVCNWLYMKHFRVSYSSWLIRNASSSVIIYIINARNIVYYVYLSCMLCVCIMDVYLLCILCIINSHNIRFVLIKTH